MKPKDVLLNICVAGRTISRDVKLTKALGAKHNVSQLRKVAQLSKPFILSELKGTDVLVLDCGEKKELLMSVISNITECAPHLRIVLVNGGLTTKDVATALAKGAADYLGVPSTPDEIELFAERVEILGVRARRARVAARDGRGQRRTLHDGDGAA